MTETNNKDTSAKILALVSHKLRTPLSIITGYSEAISAQSKQEKFSHFTQKAFEEINKQGNKMAGLVDKILNFTRAEEMDARHLQKEEFEVKPLLVEAAGETLARQDEHGQLNIKNDRVTKGSLSVEINCQPSCRLNANKELIKTAAQEIMDNAFKFNNRIEKNLKIYIYNHGAQSSVSFKDTGAGIRPQDVNSVFERFYQVDDFFTGQIEGFGLGLPLVKRIMDLHGGSVSVVSDKNLGSIFTLNIPN